jgi:hypothetical protein
MLVFSFFNLNSGRHTRESFITLKYFKYIVSTVDEGPLNFPTSKGSNASHNKKGISKMEFLNISTNRSSRIH